METKCSGTEAMAYGHNDPMALLRFEIARTIMASMYAGRARQLLDIDHEDCAHHACLAADALLSAMEKTAKKEENR